MSRNINKMIFRCILFFAIDSLMMFLSCMFLFLAYHGMMIHLLAGYMDYFVVLWCLAHISLWIAFFFRVFYRLLSILMHFQNTSIFCYRKSLRKIPKTWILMNKPERHYFELSIFIIWFERKSMEWIYNYMWFLSIKFMQTIQRDKRSLFGYFVCSIGLRNLVYCGESIPNGYG